MSVLFSSALYRQAANLEPSASGVVNAATHCVMCAAPLEEGDRANPLTRNTFGDAFNNKLDLRALSGTHVCGDCQALWSKDWLQKYSKTFACTQGVFKLASNDDLAAFLLTPPEPPFCAIISTRQQQHMIWRTPVSLSQDYFVVRLDGDLLTIRRAVLLDALAAYKHAEHVMATVLLDGRKKVLKGPAAMFDRQLEASTMGTLRTDVEGLLRQTGDTWVIEKLHALSIGEWWALNVLRFADLQNPPAWRDALNAANEE